MKNRRFQPVAVDALEDRLVLTAFAVPFTIVSTQTTEVNPKFLNLTGRTESLISSSITNAFNRFSHSITNDINAYNKAISKPNADTTAAYNKLLASGAAAFNRLSGDLSYVAHKLPFGGENLNPILQARISGANGVTDTTTKVNTPSLATQFATAIQQGNASTSQAKSLTDATEALVRSDVKNYINLGVTNGYFKLTRGAFLPALS